MDENLASEFRAFVRRKFFERLVFQLFFEQRMSSGSSIDEVQAYLRARIDSGPEELALIAGEISQDAAKTAFFAETARDEYDEIRQELDRIADEIRPQVRR